MIYLIFIVLIAIIIVSLLAAFVQYGAKNVLGAFALIMAIILLLPSLGWLFWIWGYWFIDELNTPDGRLVVQNFWCCLIFGSLFAVPAILWLYYCVLDIPGTKKKNELMYKTAIENLKQRLGDGKWTVKDVCDEIESLRPQFFPVPSNSDSSPKP